MTKPPAIKQQVATRDGHCRLEIPIMACPDVQPPAYLVPKPTKKPPITIKIKPLKVRSWSKLKTSFGSKPLKSLIPCCCNTAWVCGLISTGWLANKNCAAMNPPKTMPATKKRFQLSFFQSYLKNEILAGIHAAQMCLSDDEMPKVLLPMISRAGTTRPISGPATYQGQGWVIKSIVCKLIIPANISNVNWQNINQCLV